MGVVIPFPKRPSKPSEVEATIIYLAEISYFHYEQYEKAQRDCWAFVFSPWLETMPASRPAVEN